MNSQNRMNAGAEYVLYRIWATLQDRDGIHAESLLACMGALAGYACQAYVRRVGARGADASAFALSSVTTTDGTTFLDGEALSLPLRTSPLSVWTLVRCAVQKLGAPLPDIDGISAHVTCTLGTSEFGVPRTGDARRPRALPIVYLRQLWPQVLPIAQRFCRRPAQLPVLFGIALQRAIEHTTSRLNPTLAASLAMECAIAMSKAVLPATSSDLFQISPPASGLASAAAPSAAFAPNGAGAEPMIASARSAEMRAIKRRRASGVDPKTLEAGFGAGFFGTRVRSGKVAATVLSLTIVAVTSAAWKRGRDDSPPAVARVATELRAPAFPVRATGNANAFEQATPFEQPMQQAQMDGAEPPAEEAPPVQNVRQPLPPPPPEDADLPAPTPDQGEGIIAPDWQSA